MRKLTKLLFSLTSLTLALSLLTSCGPSRFSSDALDVPKDENVVIEEIDLPNADDLADIIADMLEGKLDRELDEKVGERSTYPLYTSKQFSQWFPGVACEKGTRIAANTPAGSSPYAIVLIEPSEGTDAEELAGVLEEHVNVDWATPEKTEIVKHSVKSGYILFVFTSPDAIDADAIVAAFEAEV